MNKTIREASTRLLALLPTHTDHYSIDDLIRVGFPEAVVERIQVDLADALTRSIRPPVTEWADMASPRVQEAWRGFLDAIHTEVVLPRNRAAEMVDNAVIEVIEALVMPRRRLPELLFGLHRQLSRSELIQRSRYVTVHKVLVEALVRYMDRKAIDTIDRSTALKVIEIVDERYVSSFTPLNWAQSLDPLFKLAGSRVDPDLIRDFFIDKGREDLATRFAHLGYRVERTHLIEVLSEPILDDDGMEYTPPPVTEVRPLSAVEHPDDLPISVPTDDRSQHGSEISPLHVVEIPVQVSSQQSDNPDPHFSDLGIATSETEPLPEAIEEPATPTLADLLAQKSGENVADRGAPDAAWARKEVDDPLVPIQELPEAVPVYKLFEKDDEAGEASTVQEESTEPIPLVGRLVGLDHPEDLPMYRKYASDEAVDDKDVASEGSPSDLHTEFDTQEPDSEPVPDDEDHADASAEVLINDRRPLAVDAGVPIWQRFLSDIPENLEEEEDTSDTQPSLFDALSNVETDDVGPQPALGVPTYAESAPAGNFTMASLNSGADRGSLRARLKKMESDVVSEIFGGEKADYLLAIQSLELMEDWKQAQQYIKREILPHVQVDPYDEIFVAFVDELQAYFTS